MTNQANPFLDLDPDVARIDLSRIRYQLTQAPEAVMSAVEWSEAETLYLRFLMLKKLYPLQLLVPPRPALDLWQSHILDTRAYRADCDTAFGRFIDHYPCLGMNGPAEQRELEYAQQLYMGLYEHHFSGVATCHPSAG